MFQPCYDLSLIFSKSGFAFLRENLGDALSRLSLDQLVGIDEMKTEHRRDQVADRRFSSYHKTDQCQISNFSGFIHLKVLPEGPTASTRILSFARTRGRVRFTKFHVALSNPGPRYFFAPASAAFIFF